MRPKYDGIRYYTPCDWAFGHQVKRTDEYLLKYNSDTVLSNINEFLELHNIVKIVNSEEVTQLWDVEKRTNYRTKVKSFKAIIARYFSTITDSNFIEIEKNVCLRYLDDFWEVFENTKTFNHISDKEFKMYLEQPDTTLYKILEHKNIVNYYDSQIANFMRTSEQSARIIVTKFMKNSKSKCIIPHSLAPHEYEAILSKYIDSPSMNVNILQLISNYQSTAECPISDKTRLKAKRAIDAYWKKPGVTAITSHHGIGITFQIQDEVKAINIDGSDYHLTYDVRWLEDNLDYATVLNNFIYVFDMFDNFFRSTLVSVKSKIGALEGSFLVEGNKYFHKGHHFNINSCISSAQMSMYYDFLNRHGIELESIFKWFFEKYLPDEFGVQGFFMTASSASASTVERCRNLASEMDGILKQYRMFVRDGKIDREEFEMSSEHLIINGFPTLICDKYAYANSPEINQEMFMLFSDQSLLGYTKGEDTRHSTFIEILVKEETNRDDYEEYQLHDIDWLIDRRCVEVSKEGFFTPVTSKYWILRDLYDHDVICLYKIRNRDCNLDSDLQYMIDNRDLKVESTLFSKPETDFLNYELNKAEFSNSLDLRNKYAHSTYQKNEDEQKHDYMELLKIMILIITKINDEFCETYPERKGVENNEL